MEEIIVKNDLERIYKALTWCINLKNDEWHVRIPMKISKPHEDEGERACNNDEIIQLVSYMREALNDGAKLDQTTTFVFGFENKKVATEFKEKHSNEKISVAKRRYRS